MNSRQCPPSIGAESGRERTFYEYDSSIALAHGRRVRNGPARGCSRIRSVAAPVGRDIAVSLCKLRFWLRLNRK
jgi:hypothetical protein